MGLPRLVVVVGPKSGGKTALAHAIAEHLACPVIQTGLELSRRLLEIEIKRRPLDLEEELKKLVSACETPAVVLDNTEFLFEGHIQAKPLTLLERLAKNRLVVATWSGEWVEPSLIFGYPSHPAHCKLRPRGYPLIDLSQGNPAVYYPS